MGSDHVRVQFYLPRDQVTFLNEKHRETLKPRAFFVREAIRIADLLLKAKQAIRSNESEDNPESADL